jgi:hypothetical protein
MGNYSSFTTAFLTLVEIERWNDALIIIDQVTTLDFAPEDEFVDAVRRVQANMRFNNRIRRTSVIDGFGQMTGTHTSALLHITADQVNGWTRGNLKCTGEGKGAHVSLGVIEQDGKRGG